MNAVTRPSPTRAARGALPRLLVISSGPAGGLRAYLESGGLEVHEARPDGDVGDMVDSLSPGALLLSRDLAGEELAELLRRVRERRAIPCVLGAPELTGEALTLAIRVGADTVFAYSWPPVMLHRIAQRARRVRAAGDGEVELPPLLLGGSSAMRETWRLVLLAAESDASVLITGETGTGKEIVARALHRFSPRRPGPFIAINCAAVPETLLESELFGHERGAFTGADAQRQGTFERAAGGTLFLDEIGEMPPALQAKLLRVLQERAFQRIGGSKLLSLDARVVAATNRPLRDDIEGGRFREDLFYRLCSLSVHVPPLRERAADVFSLWEHLVSEIAAREGRTPPQTSPAVNRWLMQYEWPGNLRELENVVRHILTVAADGPVGPSDLPNWVMARPSGLGGAAGRRHGLAGLSMKEIERAAIIETYDALGTIRATAQALEISPRKVQYRLKEYRERGYLPSKSSAARADVGTPRSLRVLLAEDDDELRWALAELLESDGCEVVAVRDGSAFLEKLGVALLVDQDAAPIDVVIADLRMPGLSGLQILQGVRARGWRIPVVVMSAFGDERTRAEAEALGATAFLDKPLDMQVLQDIMRAAMH